jgi:hypothetical protein
MPLSTPYMLEYDLAVWTLPAAILMMRCWRGDGRAADWGALPILWLLPPVTWLASQANINFAALIVLALVPYVVWTVRRESNSEAAETAENTVGFAAVAQ